jgi:type VI secretion system protein VasG
VNLSHRYIPARQLPDKAVSLLDTAAARVAISQSATPALIEDVRVSIVAREAEKTALVGDSDLGIDEADRVSALDTDIAALKDQLATLECEWAREQDLVKDSRSKAMIRPQNAPNCALNSTRWRVSHPKSA